VVVGQVTDVGDPQGQSRVKLTFPWLSETYVSDWARTVQPGAGKERGATVLPEVGDEVLVAFEQGDIRRPYALGGLYNGVDTPDRGGGAAVDERSGAVNRRSLVSRRGHRLDLHDEDGRTEGVSLATGDGKLRLTLDATGTTITVHSDGTVKVEGSKGVVVDAGPSTLELKGAEVKVSATRAISVDAGADLKLKGGALCSVSAATVKIN
jgi:uncharacterized protein involved in type VI secretion and phage assembly